MLDADRFRLLGTYSTPRCRVGQWVRCEVRGKVQVAGLTDAPIPWPFYVANGWRVPIVYKSLAEAVRRESEQAVAHHWRVSLWAVRKWRRALGVGATTEGTSRLRSDYTQEPQVAAGLIKAQTMPWTDERREQNAANKRGKARPQHVIEAMREGRTGKPHSDETREKMSEAHKARGTLVPGTDLWTAEEDEAVRTLKPSEAAQKTGRTLVAVKSRRRILKVPDGRKERHLRKPLSLEQIILWAEAHRRRTGKWPTTQTGPVTEAPEETWLKIDAALRRGQRGLPGGKSLRQLLRDKA